MPVRALLNLLTGKRSDAGGTGVAVFGKHPAFGDHIQEGDIPLQTPALREFYETLYKRGITNLVETGELSRLIEGGVDAPWGHSVLWRGREGAVTARIWPSRDKVGRTLYPLVACVQHDAISPADLCRVADPMLAAFGARIEPAAEPEQVLEAVAELRARAAALPVPGPNGTAGEDVVQAIAAHPDLGPQRLLPIFREFGDWLDAGGLRLGLRSGYRVRADTVRVPRCAPDAPSAAGLWFRFVAELGDGAGPVLVMAAEANPWVDVFVGPAAPSQFRCLRAAEQAAPLTTAGAEAEEFDPRLIDAVREFLARHNVPPDRLPSNSPTPPDEQTGPTTI